MKALIFFRRQLSCGVICTYGVDFVSIIYDPNRIFSIQRKNIQYPPPTGKGVWRMRMVNPLIFPKSQFVYNKTHWRPSTNDTEERVLVVGFRRDGETFYRTDGRNKHAGFLREQRIKRLCKNDAITRNKSGNRRCVLSII